MKRLIVALLLGSLLLTACASIRYGVVVRKDHADGYYYTTVAAIGTGKNVTYVPETHYSPPWWTVTFTGKNKKGEKENRTVSVNEDEYGSAHVGQMYSMDPE